MRIKGREIERDRREKIEKAKQKRILSMQIIQCGGESTRINVRMSYKFKADKLVNNNFKFSIR